MLWRLIVILPNIYIPSNLLISCWYPFPTNFGWLDNHTATCSWLKFSENTNNCGDISSFGWLVDRACGRCVSSDTEIEYQDDNFCAHSVHAMHGVYGSAYAYCDYLPILICCLAEAREVGWVGVATLLAGDCCCDESASLSSEGSWSLFYYTIIII